MSDVIDTLAGIEPGSPLDAIRNGRLQARTHAQASYDSLFKPLSEADASKLERIAIACFVSGELIVIVLPFVPPLVQLSAAPTVNVTGLPEAPPVAITSKGASPYVLSASVPKFMAWLACPTACENVPPLAVKLVVPL